MTLRILEFWNDDVGHCGSALIDTKLTRDEVKKEIYKVIKEMEKERYPNKNWEIAELLATLQRKKILVEIDTKNQMIEI